MKIHACLIILLIIPPSLIAQQPTPVPITPAKTDTAVKTHYGDLLKDNPFYEKKYPVWIPAAEVIGFNALLLGLNKYAFKFDFAVPVGSAVWKKNLKSSWEWDTDKFGVNFIGHPYAGSVYYNSARSNGYTFLQSVPFAFGGSLLWEYFGEDTRPSYNDIINTPVTGIFFGEIIYRISSNVLNDHKRGRARWLRESAAGFINPMREFNRAWQGKLTRTTSDTIYQEDLMSFSAFGGLRKNNDGTDFNSGSQNAILNLSIVYGDPFENRRRKPYDYFKLRTEFNFRVGTKILDNITGYAFLTGRNANSKSVKVLYGLFQHYNYWDNTTFELGTIAFGGGVVTKIPINKSAFYNNLYVNGVPFAGNSTRFAPTDTAQFRDYNFGGGMQTTLESSFDFKNIFTLTLLGYFYWIRTYAGTKEDSYISLLKPSISVTLYKNIRVGFEHLLYINNRYYPDKSHVNLSHTEQKVFVLIYFDNARYQRKYEK